MAKRKAKPRPKRRRRKHSEEFKREAVQLVHDEHLSVAEAARNGLCVDMAQTGGLGGIHKPGAIRKPLGSKVHRVFGIGESCRFHVG